MTAVDEVLTVIALLESTAAVTALATDGIYGEELPQTLSGNDAPRAIVVSATGGPPAPAGPQLRTPRVDVRAYGPTPAIAKAIALAVTDAMTWIVMTTAGSARIYASAPDADILTGREPDTFWPFAWQSFVLTLAR